MSRTDETACFMILKTCHNVQRRAGRRLELMLIRGVSPLPLVHGETSYHMMRLVIKAARSVKREGFEDHDDLPTGSIYPGFRCTAVNVNAVAQNISYFVDVEHTEVRWENSPVSRHRSLQPDPLRTYLISPDLNCEHGNILDR